MHASELEFIVEGSDNDETLRALESKLREAVPDWSFTRRAQPGMRPDTRDAGAGIAIAALILAAPSAIDATWNLAERVELKRKLQSLLTWAKTLVTDHPGRRVYLRRRGTLIPLDEAELNTVVSALDALARREER